MEHLVGTLVWAGEGLASGPGHAQFWVALAASAFLYLPLGMVVVTWLIGLRQRAASAARNAVPVR